MFKFREFIAELSKPTEISKFKKDVGHINQVDARDSSWMDSLKAYMSKYGFRKLGSGKYASVYGNDKYPYVIKVFMKDAAYLRWIKFVQANQSNPYLPRLKGKILKITPFVYAMRLEKLTPYSNGGQFMKDFSTWKSNNGHKSSDPNIQEILNDFTKNKALIDLHGDNMMMRGDQLVIIDPYYNFWGKSIPGKFAIDPDKIDPSIF